MRLGLLAYASNTGLGYQTYQFYKHMKPVKTLVADLSRFNGMPIYKERFPDGRFVTGIPQRAEMDWLTDDVDAVFVAETPLNYDLYELAKRKGVATVQQYNYEFLDFFQHPAWAKPSILAAPTIWNADKVKALNVAPVVDWPVPVNREDIPFREIKQLKNFVHIIGRPAVHDRNGTLSFLQAAKKIGDRFKYTIYLQKPTDRRAMEYHAPVARAIDEASQSLHLEVIEDIENYNDMYKFGSVLVLPRRYGGLCLPMQEALSAGMPVIMTDIDPNYQRLPKQWLVKAYKKKQFFAHVDIDVYEAEVNHLTFAMLQFDNTEYMQWSNKEANSIAEGLSWENQKQLQSDLFQQIVQ